MLTLAEIADMLGGELQGEGARQIHRLATIQSAGPDALTFIANPLYRHYLHETRAGAVLCTADEAAQTAVATITVKDPYLAYAKLSHQFETLPKQPPGVHATAVVADDVKVPDNAHIGPNAVVESGVSLGEGCVVMAAAYVGANTTLGHQVVIHPHATLYHDVHLGDRCIVHSQAVIGADGFGFAYHDGWERIAQIGKVVVGDDVNIGAGTTIDRGALDDTRIGKGVIIDNQVQIAHNVIIGDHTAIAGTAGIAGSTRVGKHCMIGGAAGLAGHIEICDHVNLMGMAMVTGSITKPGNYASGTSLDTVSRWRKNVARFRNLNEIYKRLRRLEKT